MVLNARTDRYRCREVKPPAALLDETLQRGQAFLNLGATAFPSPAAPTPTPSPRWPSSSDPGGTAGDRQQPGPHPGNWLRLGVARLFHGGSATHRHTLAALTGLAASLRDNTSIDNYMPSDRQSPAWCKPL